MIESLIVTNRSASLAVVTAQCRWPILPEKIQPRPWSAPTSVSLTGVLATAPLAWRAKWKDNFSTESAAASGTSAAPSPQGQIHHLQLLQPLIRLLKRSFFWGINCCFFLHYGWVGAFYIFHTAAAIQKNKMYRDHLSKYRFSAYEIQTRKSAFLIICVSIFTFALNHWSFSRLVTAHSPNLLLRLQLPPGPHLAWSPLLHRQKALQSACSNKVKNKLFFEVCWKKKLPRRRISPWGSKSLRNSVQKNK